MQERDSTAAWLKLASLDLRASKVIALVEAFSSVEAIFDASREQLLSVGLRAPDADKIAQAREPKASQLDLLLSGQIRLLSFNSPDFPAPLQTLYQAGMDVPAFLFSRGELKETDRFAIAIVGTRKASPYGVAIAEKLARELSEAGLCIVSGGAAGIDTAAHQSALQAQGRTLAVLGSGVDQVYPAFNRPLFERIAASGALVSEFAPDASPDRWRFPIRNRTISALSLGVIIVEAPEKSGALITAQCAAEQGKEVFVVPGSVQSPQSKGSNQLLKDGATLIDNAEDVLSALKIEPRAASSKPRAPEPSLSPQQTRILSALSLDPLHPDALARQLDFPAPLLSAELTMLELLGVARRLPGGSYVRVL